MSPARLLAVDTSLKRIHERFIENDEAKAEAVESNLRQRSGARETAH